MNAAVRLARIVAQLEGTGIACLVMGGHAVRYYGLERYTNDFDLHLSPEVWADLVERLRRTGLFATQQLQEGPSWRPADFRRFRIGTLPDGREEWLEFWRSNHLLAPFAELRARSETGTYGGSVLHFLSLPDLICSKETERDKDWDDVAILEELHDARLVGKVKSGDLPLSSALGRLRCRRGVEVFAQLGALRDPETVAAALKSTTLAITQSLLVPFAPIAELPPPTIPMEPVVLSRLRTARPASPLHFALVEIVRRQHRHVRQAADRAEKEQTRLRSEQKD